MKIKLLTSVAGVFDGRDYSFTQGNEETVKKELGDDLIQAGHAKEVKTSSKKSDDK